MKTVGPKDFYEVKRMNLISDLDWGYASDFYLPLLDPKNKDHLRYIDRSLTGSALLVYFSKKIPLINEKFADVYRFDKNNSLIYSENLAECMKQAVDMSEKRYSVLVENLMNTVKKIEKENIDNLKKIFN